MLQRPPSLLRFPNPAEIVATGHWITQCQFDSLLFARPVLTRCSISKLNQCFLGKETRIPTDPGRPGDKVSSDISWQTKVRGSEQGRGPER